MNYRIIRKNELYHHGILGQKWGIQNGPPYPLDHTSSSVKKAFGAHVRFKEPPELPREELYRAKELARKNPEPRMPIGVTRREVIEDMDKNLSDEQKQSGFVRHDYGNYLFRFANFGHNEYHMLNWEPLEPTDGPDDEVLYEMFGPNWKNEWGEYDRYRKAEKPYWLDEEDNF